MFLALAVGSATGLIFQRLQIPGGLIIGSMFGAAAVSLIRGGPEIVLPEWAITVTYLVLGASIGLTVTRELLGQLRAIAVGAVLSAVLFVVLGLLMALLLRWLGMAPDGVVLATSPGALSAMSAAGTELGVGAQVAVFHTVRVIVVLASLPLLLRIADG